MTAPPACPDPADIQRPVIYGYAFHRSRHFILQVGDAAKARAFLAGLVGKRLIASASIDNGDAQSLDAHGYSPANIGFTFAGLRMLELPEAYLRVFQEKAAAFAEGAPARAARRLADTGASAAQWWEEDFARDRAHILLSIYADEQQELVDRTAAFAAMCGADGLNGWSQFHDGCHLGADRKQRRVHFGFRDGISNPLIKGFTAREPAQGAKAPAPHEPGEFVLGYANDEKFNPWLLVNPSASPNPWLLPVAPVDPAFFRNGSFAAFRKVEQHEKDFRAFVDDRAERLGVTPAYLKAKLAGRWDDGSVIEPGETCGPEPSRLGNAGPAIADPNDFDFSADRAGEGCPFGAHIRRMNPRADLVVPFRRRPIARRGMPFGPEYDKAPAEPRGLLGLFFCASLEDQFEHLLAEWADLNPMGPDDRGNSKDPLIGRHESRRAVFDIPVRGESLCQVDGFAPFVTTRGTLYAFYPGLTALGKIARVEAPRCHDD